MTHTRLRLLLRELAAAMYRFDAYTFDPNTGELFGPRGVRRLQPLPDQLLVMLLEAEGRLIERAEVRDRLWPDITVDFDASLNTCVRQIRLALSATGDNANALETLCKRGYRITVPVERLRPPPALGSSRALRTSPLLAGVTALVLAVAATGWWRASPRSMASVSQAESATGPTRLAIVPFIDPESEVNAAFNRDLTESFVVSLTGAAPRELSVIGPSTTAVFFSGSESLASVAEAVDADFVLHGGHRSQSDVFFLEIVGADGEHVYAQRMPLDLSERAQAPSEVVTAMTRAILGADRKLR